MDYAPSLATALGVRIKWLDLSAIKDAPKFWETRKDELMKALIAMDIEYSVFEMKGFTQSAKSKIGMLLHKDQVNPFPDPKDMVRWSALTTPLNGGPDYPPVFYMRGKFVVVEDTVLGVGDGWSNIVDLKPSQVRILIRPGAERPTKKTLDKCILVKGMAMSHADIPEGFAGRLPVSAIKGLAAKGLKPGDTFEGEVMVGIKCQVGPLSRTRLGYMGVMGQLGAIFDAMKESTKRAIAKVAEFCADPLGQMFNQEFIPWMSADEIEAGASSEEESFEFFERVRAMEKTQGMIVEVSEEEDDEEAPVAKDKRLQVLPWVGWLKAKTGNAELLKSKFVASMLQEAISMQLVSAHLHPEAETWMGFACPPQHEGQLVDETVFMNPKDASKYKGEGIGDRNPILDIISIRALKVVADETVVEGLFVMTAKTFAIMAGDFDGDTMALTKVVRGDDPATPYWTGLMFDEQAKYPNTVTEKIRTTSHVEPPKTGDEAFTKALAVNVGGPTNVVIMMEAAKQIAHPRYLQEIEETQEEGKEAVQIAVDSIKHGGEQNQAIGKKARKLFTKVGGMDSDWGWAATFKPGAEARPWSLDNDWNVRPVEGISNRTAIGKHILEFCQTVPTPMVDITANSHFLHWIQPRPGVGFTEAQKAWIAYSDALALLSDKGTDWGQLKIQRQKLGQNWRDFWTAMNETASREWMESAMSGLWELAWQDEANQNRLFGTNLPVIFQLIVDDWNKPRPIEGMSGTIIGIGSEAIKTDSIVIECLGIREAKDARNMTSQFLITADNARGFKIVNAHIPTGMSNFAVTLKPLTAKTAKFTISA